MGARTLRQLRIVLSLIFLTGSTAFLCFNRVDQPLPQLAEKAQIVPSTIASSLGVILFWLAMTLLAGRIFCSTVCPLGTIQDIIIRLNGLCRGRRIFKYKPKERFKGRWHILVVYLIGLIFSLGGVLWLLQPWHIAANIAAIFNSQAAASSWLTLGVGTVAGVVAGIISLLIIVLFASLSGRDYCNTVCPIGSLLASITPWSIYHIEINPDLCSGCLKCEQTCKASCINVISRHVDNTRCVRCFNCTSICPDKAINFQTQRNRPATPLFRKKARTQ